jgi:hypothetical protein
MVSEQDPRVKSGGYDFKMTLKYAGMDRRHHNSNVGIRTAKPLHLQSSFTHREGGSVMCQGGTQPSHGSGSSGSGSSSSNDSTR